MAWKDLLNAVPRSKTQEPMEFIELGKGADVLQFPKRFDILGDLAKEVVLASNDVVSCEAEVHRAELRLVEAKHQRQEIRDAYRQAQDKLGVTDALVGA